MYNNEQYLKQQCLSGNLGGGLQPGNISVAPSESPNLTQQAVSHTHSLTELNVGLAKLREALFGEAEMTGRDSAQQVPTPSLPSVAASLHKTGGLLSEAHSQLHSILNRL